MRLFLIAFFLQVRIALSALIELRLKSALLSLMLNFLLR